MNFEMHDDGFTVTLPNGGQVLVASWISELDGVPVVQIDTEPSTGRFRINLNDNPIWEGDPEK